MNARVEPVSFDNRDNVRLFGILHREEDARKDVAIIILSPGIKSRVAPHRLYVKMASRFCQMGFCVLRFDPCGIGDSQGEIEERMVADFYASVQVGRFVNDTIDAMDWMERQQGVSRFILAGLCGGAITGLLTGAIDKRVKLLLGIGMPVILDSASKDKSKYISKGQLEELRDSYLKKLLDPKSWMRFLSLKSDYSLIYRAVMTAIKRNYVQSPKTDPVSKRELNAANLKSIVSSGNMNPYFPLAMHKMSTQRRVCMIFSGADRLHWEFEEKYLRIYANEYQLRSNNIGIHIIKKANHILSFTEWQNEVFTIFVSELKRWLNEQSQTIHYDINNSA